MDYEEERRAEAHKKEVSSAFAAGFWSGFFVLFFLFLLVSYLDSHR